MIDWVPPSGVPLRGARSQVVENLVGGLFGDGSAEDTARDVQHAFGASGSYAVELRVTDEDGATARADTYAAAGSYDVGLTVSDDGGLTGSTGRPVTVPSPTPVLGVSPSHLSFRVYAFRPDQPPSQQLTIANVGCGRVRWTARDNGYWLRLQPTEGTAPARVTVSVDRSAIPIGINGYRPGYLQASIVVSAVGASTTSVTVPVSVTISYQR